MPNHSLYPWDKWFKSSRPFRLVKGTDYDCMTHSMAQHIRNRAGKLGRRVSLSIEGDTVTVSVIKKGKSRGTKKSR